MIVRRMTLATTLITIVVAGCGGGAASPSASDESGQTAAPSIAGDPAVTAAPPTSASTDAPQAGGGTVTDACTLLSDAELEELTGYKVDRSAAGMTQGIFENGCRWTMAGGSTSAVPAEVVLGVYAPGGRSLWDRSYGPFVSDDGNRPIEGVGEGAIVSIGNAIVTVQGDALVGVQYVDGLTDDEETLVKIAQKVLENLRG